MHQRGDEAVDGVRIGLGVHAQPAVARGLRRHRADRDDELARPAIGPTASQKLSTVDDDVNVIASTSPARTRARSAGSGSTGTVRYTASTSTA